MRRSRTYVSVLSHCQYQRSLHMKYVAAFRGVPFMKHVGMQFVLD